MGGGGLVVFPCGGWGGGILKAQEGVPCTIKRFLANLSKFCDPFFCQKLYLIGFLVK